jgi:glycosyltransferase involved in cell wall biosynthesis
MRWYRHLPSAWITLTQTQAAGFKSWAAVSQPILILRNAVAVEIERAARDMPAKRPRWDPFRVLILGRLDAGHKGLDLLLAYLQAHADALLASGLAFRIVGDGPYRATLERALQSDPVLNRLVVLEPWSDPLPCYVDADCTLLTSRYEGVPLVMLESMAMGVPMVASRLPGVSDYLDPKCQFEVGDIAGAVACILGLRDCTERERTVSFNRARFEALASADAFSRNTTELSQALLTLCARGQKVPSPA